MNIPELNRTQRRVGEMRRSIIEAAESIVFESGTAFLTTEEVAKRADVSIQTVYNRVGGKPALLIAIAERALEENRKYMDEAYESSGTPEERILRAALAYARFAAERPHQFQVLANPPNEPEALVKVASLTQEQNQKLANVLRDGLKTGDMNPLIDPDDVATAIWAMMNGVLGLAWRTDSLKADVDELNRLLATTFMIIGNGLRKPIVAF